MRGAKDAGPGVLCSFCASAYNLEEIKAFVYPGHLTLFLPSYSLLLLPYILGKDHLLLVDTRALRLLGS